MLQFLGFSILFGLFVLIIFLQLKVLYKKNIVKKVCLRVNDIRIMFYVSATWILLIVIYALYSWTNQNDTSHIKLNEWGDFLAGFFAPLLFAWLVYGVFIQKKEFAKVSESAMSQIKEMKDQVTQTEIQQLNTWFNRNINTINMIKNNLFKNIKVNNVDSIALIYHQLKQDFKQEENYFNIFDELKSILDIFLYIEETINNLQNTKKSNEVYTKSLKEIKNEFNTLFDSEINDIKGIMTIVYFLIGAHHLDRESLAYKKYSIYHKWLTEYDDISNCIINSKKDNIENTLKEIFTKIDSITINFKTGKLYGSI